MSRPSPSTGTSPGHTPATAAGAPPRPGALVGLHRPSAEETAFGWLFGHLPVPPDGRAGGASPDRGAPGAREVLESQLLTALRAGPVAVAFSGGRDSSALLALAAHLSAREGLPPPVPVTLEYDSDDAAEESAWAELVVSHLVLPGWLRLPVGASGTAVLGPRGRALLTAAQAPVFPPGGLAGARLAEHVATLAGRGSGGEDGDAGGGEVTLVTGEHGDEVLGGRRAAVLALLRRRRGRVPARLWRRAALALAPRPVVARRARRRAEPPPWLRPGAARRFAALAGRDRAGPLRAAAEVTRLGRRRAVVVGSRTTAAVAAAYGVRRLDPLGSPQFLAAWARESGWTGFPNRAAALRHLVGDLLPGAVLARTSKARFNASRFGPAAGWYAEHWDGQLSGELDALVDPDALRWEWRQPAPHALSLSLLQHVWFATGRGAPWQD